MIESDKIQYLQMIQNTVARMSTASAIFKGFSATIVSGIALISLREVNIWVLGLSFVPVVIFCILDIYYLRLERINRYWYDQVRLGKKPVDFKLAVSVKEDKINQKEAKIRIFTDCMLSKSICLFYPSMIVILVTVLVMKCEGVV